MGKRFYYRGNMLKCNPPYSCFKCPYEDCVAPSTLPPTDAEHQYMRDFFNFLIEEKKELKFLESLEQD